MGTADCLMNFTLALLCMHWLCCCCTSSICIGFYQAFTTIQVLAGDEATVPVPTGTRKLTGANNKSQENNKSAAN